MKQVVEDLINGYEFLQINKWGQGQMYHPKTDAYCALGCIKAAIGAKREDDGVYLYDYATNPRFENCRTYLNDAVPDSAAAIDRSTNNKAVWLYNDQPGRTKEDIEKLFLDAIKLAEKAN